MAEPHACPTREGPHGPGALSVGLSVALSTAAVEDLKAKGVDFSRITEDGFVKLAFFADPDGNPSTWPRRSPGRAD